MKNKLKTRLFAALALSGVSFCWPLDTSLGQVDDYGFVHAVTSAPDSVQRPASQPAAGNRLAPLPALVGQSHAARALGNASQLPVPRSSDTPKPFAPSNIFGGAYVPSPTATQNSGLAANDPPNSNTHSGQAVETPLLPNYPHIAAQRELPPIVPSERFGPTTELPPIVAADDGHQLPPVILPIEDTFETTEPPIISRDDSELQPDPTIVSPAEAGIIAVDPPTTTDDTLFEIRQPSEIDVQPPALQTAELATSDTSMVQSSYLLNADGEVVSEPPTIQKTAFVDAPVVIQDGPPSIESQVVPLELPGQLPAAGSGSRGGLLPSAGSGARDSLLPGNDPVVAAPDQLQPRGIVPSGSGSRQSVIDNGIQIEPVAVEPSAVTSVVPSDTEIGHSSVCGCQSCGNNGCYDPNEISGLFNTAGANSLARRYLIGEVLYFDRDESTIINSNFGGLNGSDFDAGWRFTIGNRSDSTRGRELTYSGTSDIGDSLTVNSAGGLIDAGFNVPVVGAAFSQAGTLSPFFNANTQTQTTDSFFHSIEFNRVRWGWDVMKSYIGLRYIYFDDSYSLTSQQDATLVSPVQAGTFEIDAVNHLIGPHIGAELFYDVGYRWSLSGFSKFGVYANFNEVDTNLVSNGTEFINADDSSASIATSYEANLTAKFRISQRSQFRVGYNILWLGEVATVADNLADVTTGGTEFTPAFGTFASDSDETFFHGLSIGLEFYR